MISTLLLVALSQTPQHWLFRQPNLPTASYAFLEFAPASGAGMGAVCACTTPTGAKGEAMTFTRASTATCTKTAAGGLATSGIANGDLVTCSTNQPRVEYDSAGILGLLVESARTNSILRSEELNNAAWTWENGGGAAATTRTSDYAVAPDGTTTAERLEIPATTGVQYSDEYQTFTVASGSGFACSVYVKGTSTSGTTDICGYDGGASWACSECNFVAGSWTRCTKTWASGTAISRACKLGNNSNQNGGAARSAVDILAWGFQGEAGAYATSYMATGAALANRLVEAASFTLSTATGPAFSMAASAAWPSSSVGAVTVAQLGTAAPNLASIGRSTDTAGAFTINATSTTPAVSAIGTTGQRIALADDGTNESAFWQSSSVAAPNGDMAAGSTAFSLGVLDGVASRICIDPSPSRCR